MLTNTHVPCPICDTHYPAERLGIPIEANKRAVIICPVCQSNFDLAVHPVQPVVTEHPGTWRTLWFKTRTVSESSLRIATNSTSTLVQASEEPETPTGSWWTRRFKQSTVTESHLEIVTSRRD